MLDIIEIEHHVVPHLEGKTDFFDLLLGRKIGCFRRIQRCHCMTNRRAIDLDEHQPEFACHVFHQRGFAVSRWGDEKQQPHRIGSLRGPHSTELFGQIRPNQR